MPMVRYTRVFGCLCTGELKMGVAAPAEAVDEIFSQNVCLSCDIFSTLGIYMSCLSAPQRGGMPRLRVGIPRTRPDACPGGQS